MKSVFKILLFCVIFLGVERFCHWQTGGFTLQKIRSIPSCRPIGVSSPLTNDQLEHVQSILSQPFSYCGSGNSCYAFQSHDGSYILKVFKQHHLHPLPWANKLPLRSHWRAHLEKKQCKRERVFLSCIHAFDELRELTGLIYVHLHPTHQINQSITLIDRLGIEHHLAADASDFVLQKKAVLARAHFDQLIEENDLKAAERSLQSIAELHAKIAERGFKDLDPNIETNVGFIDGKAIKIDVGCLVKDERFCNERLAQKHVQKAIQRFKQNLLLHHPELSQDIETRQLQNSTTQKNR